MNTVATLKSPPVMGDERSAEPSERVISGSSSNELVFGVVGHVGSGTSEVAEVLKAALSSEELVGGKFDAHIVKASELIKSRFADTTTEPLNAGIEGAFRLQDFGDKLRRDSQDNTKVAKELIATIRRVRADATKEVLIAGAPVMPDGARRAYVLDSLRHPDEVRLLRAVYQEAFVLVGVVCEPASREMRLARKYKDAGAEAVQKFMVRDADSETDREHGQKVAETFFMSDYFVDNTPSRFTTTGGVDKPNPDWSVADELRRLVDMVTHDKIVRPTLAETAMYHAQGARMRSACLSRQVGAALVDQSGEVIATGCNEAPKAGGGVYSGGGVDFRCAFHHGYCSSVREQNRIIDEIVAAFPELQASEMGSIQSRLRKSPIGGLLEFSRAVHAEMDALLSAARKGISTVGSKLYVTTYPCHYCARHVVAAGVSEVQYIEPYPKSLAGRLHDDAIANDAASETKVLFKPFTGVAPRLYRRAFLKAQSLKDRHTGDMRIGPPDWGSPLSIRRDSYIELEAKLAHAN